MRSNKESKKLQSVAGAPWARQVYKLSIEDLHYQIVHLSEHLSPTFEEHSMRESALSRVQFLMAWIFPSSKVLLFGSVASKIYLPNSDLDITVEWNDKQEMPDLNYLASIFRLTGFYQSVVVIDKAAIPLLKLVEAGSGMHIDVSFNVQSFYAVCDWVEKMRTECKFLHPLVLVLKQFLSVNNLNSPFNGGLPSYALVVMVAHFLKSVDMDALPPKLKQTPLGALLLMFLDFYGREFDYKSCVIAFDVDTPVIYDKASVSSSNAAFGFSSLLTIIDPVDKENDLGRGAYNVYSVKNAFLRASDVLRSFIRSEDNESADASLPALSLIVPIPPADIIGRNMALRNFLAFNRAYQSE